MYRKGVSALVLNKNNQFLLVNLESFKEMYFAIPGGGVEEGESLEDAVYRELFEELGIKRESLQLVGKSDGSLRFKFREITLSRDGKEYEGSERYFFGFHFIGEENDIQPQDGEVRTYKWVSYSELEKHLLFEDQLENTVEKIKEIFPSFAFEG